MREIRRKGVGRSWEKKNSKGTWKHVKSTIYIYIAWGFISNVKVRIGGRKVGRRWEKIRKRHGSI